MCDFVLAILYMSIANLQERWLRFFWSLALFFIEAIYIEFYYLIPLGVFLGRSTVLSSYVCLRSFYARQSLIAIAFWGPWEHTPLCVFSGLADVLLLSGNSEWHSGDAAGRSQFLPAVLFIYSKVTYWAAGLCLNAAPSALTLKWTLYKQKHFFPAEMVEKLVHLFLSKLGTFQVITNLAVGWHDWVLLSWQIFIKLLTLRIFMVMVMVNLHPLHWIFAHFGYPYAKSYGNNPPPPKKKLGTYFQLYHPIVSKI